ncbi:MAG: ATP-binding protein, partial [Dehalococcoidia bacterium]
RFIYVNPGAERIMQQDRRDVLGCSVWELFPGMTGTEFERQYRRAAEEHRTVIFEAFYPPFNAWYELRVFPSEDGLSIYYRDITEAKRIEAERASLLVREQAARMELEALAESRALYEAAVLTMTEGLAIMDAQSRVLFWNPRLAELVDIPAAAAEGRTLAEAAEPLIARIADREAAGRADREAIASALAGKAAETSFRLEGAVPRDLVKRYFPVQGPRGLLGFGCLVRDATQERTVDRLKDELVRESEQANRAKSEFLSRMSHELRTPMNAILGFAQLLEMDPLEAEQREGVEQILSAGGHLLTLINEVLDITRIEAGRLDLSLEAVPLLNIIKECRPLVGALAASRSVRLELGERALGRAHVRADAQRLKQVLLNLLSNAVKYNREGGRVTLTGHKLEDERLRIEVQDTGNGLSEEKLSRLFSPFDRLGAEQTNVEGSGLGLSLSKSLMEAMGGRIGVASVEGEGSCFWLELPLIESPMAASGIDEPAATETEPAAAAARTVLYIEDNLSNLRVVERVLSRRPGVRLLTAMQGGLGLELARQHRPDLILLDVHLPDTTGDVVLRQLQADPGTRELPVVVVSADATARQIERLLAAGARAYLTKPLDLKRFMEVIDALLAGGSL